MSKYSVAIFVDGIYRRTVTQIETLDHAMGISSGVCIGIGLLNGAAATYVLPLDDAAMREDQRAEEVAKVQP